MSVAELANLRQDFTRQADRNARTFFTKDLAHLLFVCAIDEGKKEANRNRLDPHLLSFRAAARADRTSSGVTALPLVVDPLPHTDTAMSRNDRIGRRQLEVEQALSVIPPQLQHVAEALGHEESRLHAGIFEQCVGNRRSTEDDHLGVLEHVFETAAVGRRGIAQDRS